MIIVSNSAPVVLTPGQALTFNTITWKSGCAESFRLSGSAVRAARGVYDLSFSGNITNASAAAAVQLALAVDGSVLPETTMISTPSAINALNNVATSTVIGNQGNCCNNNPGSVSITVVNNGTTDVTVGANAKLTVKRIG